MKHQYIKAKVNKMKKQISFMAIALMVVGLSVISNKPASAQSVQYLGGATVDMYIRSFGTDYFISSATSDSNGEFTFPTMTFPDYFVIVKDPATGAEITTGAITTYELDLPGRITSNDGGLNWFVDFSRLLS